MIAKDVIKKIDNNQNLSHKMMFSFEKRIQDSTQVKLKYPDRIPVICEKHYDNIKLEHLSKKKYLVPIELTIAEFMFIIRKNICIHPHEAIFISIGHIIPPSNTMFGHLYHEYKDADGYLYITYTSENTFG